MKVLITGGTGMVGSAFKEIQTNHQLIFVGSRDYNLTSLQETSSMIAQCNPDAIIHLAAKVGGVKNNIQHAGDFFYDNIMINTNVLESARRKNVKKVVSLLSTCIYPVDTQYPMRPEQIHNGEPHETHFAYAYSKRMLDVQSRAYRKQWGSNFVTAIPGNIYGPNDLFDLDNCHVIPAVIRKVWEAKIKNKKLSFWGDGSSLREFTYSKDVARAMMFLLENYDEKEPINIGYTEEYSIKELVDIVCTIFDYRGLIQWEGQLGGQFRKPSDNSRFKDITKNKFSYTTLYNGLEKTCKWFVSNYPNLRGM